MHSFEQSERVRFSPTGKGSSPPAFVEQPTLLLVALGVVAAISSTMGPALHEYLMRRACEFLQRPASPNGCRVLLRGSNSVEGRSQRSPDRRSRGSDAALARAAPRAPHKRYRGLSKASQGTRNRCSWVLSSPRHVVPKLLTENQVLSEPTHSRSELTTEESLDYINCYINGYDDRGHPRTWTRGCGPALDKLQVWRGIA